LAVNALKTGWPETFSLRAAAWYWGPLIGWMAAIFALSSLTAASISTAPPVEAARSASFLANQITAHMAEFSVLAVLAYRVAARLHPATGPFLAPAVLAMTAFYGATDEVHQSFVTGRHASWIDLGYDTLGAAMGVMAAMAWSWARPRIGALRGRAARS
jgi:hypothetical protein